MGKLGFAMLITLRIVVAGKIVRSPIGKETYTNNMVARSALTLNPPRVHWRTPMSNQYIADKLRPVIIPVGASIAYVELTQGQFALIDAWNVDKVDRWNWYAWWNKDTRTFYARRNIWTPGGQRGLLLHNVILPPAGRNRPDHIFHRTLD